MWITLSRASAIGRSVAVTILSGIVLTRSIVRPLAQLDTTAGRIAEGELGPRARVVRQQDPFAAQTLADQPAIAIDNSRLYGHAYALAASQERQRLARDLHDVGLGIMRERRIASARTSTSIRRRERTQGVRLLAVPT